MDFGLEEHQDQLVRTSEQWIGRSWVAGEVTSADGRRALWAEVVANGWAGLLEADFGTATVLDATLLVESLAMGGCSLPIVGSGLIAPLAAEVAGVDVGSDDLGLLAFETGGDGHPTARGLEIADTVVAVRWTTDANGDRRGWEVALVSIEPEPGLRSEQTEDRFELSRFADPSALGSATWRPADPEAMELVWRVGAVLSAAEIVGLGRAVLDRCVEYAGVRVQGGKPIGGHQAIQHRLADMLAGIERSRYITYVAATEVTSDHVVAHQAKALAARDGLTAIRSAHQVMGAISFSAEHELHHFHKQALLAANEFGSANHHWRALERTSALLGRGGDIGQPDLHGVDDPLGGEAGE